MIEAGRLESFIGPLYASLVHEPGATKLLFFFFKSGPKTVLSLSLNVKCDQQTHKK
jgi:hypothetical protein